jgi:hypothetical protein
VLTPENIEKLSSDQLIRVVTVSCFDLHPKEGRNIEIGDLKKYTFIRDIMEHLSERL